MKQAKHRPPFHAYDSQLSIEYPTHRRYAVAYEPVWQSIRLDLHWAAYADACASLARCEAYINISPEEDRQNRAWRVYNLLCAIPHGQSTQIGIRIIERSVSRMLFDNVEHYKELLTTFGYPTEWDWAAVRGAAEIMQLKMPAVLKRTTDHLLFNRSKRAHAKPELRHYLRICLDAMGVEEPLEWIKRSYDV